MATIRRSAGIPLGPVSTSTWTVCPTDITTQPFNVPIAVAELPATLVSIATRSTVFVEWSAVASFPGWGPSRRTSASASAVATPPSSVFKGVSLMADSRARLNGRQPSRACAPLSPFLYTGSRPGPAGWPG